jgi:hypothetical protein
MISLTLWLSISSAFSQPEKETKEIAAAPN